jgi:flavin-binding protein dodecin
MSDSVYKKIEITGTSSSSSDDAIRNALARASKTVQKMRWFEVIDTRGTVDGGEVTQWQVTIKVGFHLLD